MKESKPWPVAGLTVGLIAVQVAVSAGGRDYYLTQMVMAAYYTVVAMSLGLVMGYAGQVSLGHGAFFALGGYTSALLTTFDLSAWPHLAGVRWLPRLGILAARQNAYGEPILTVAPWPAFLAALVVAAVAGLLIGYPSLRLKGHYLAMATLGFGLIVYRLLLGSALTGGADGITAVPPWSLAPGVVISSRKVHRVVNYYVAWGFVVLVLALLDRVIRSRVGRALRAIHDNEPAANAMGVDTARYKLQVFVVSAVLAAAAGSLLAHFNGGIGPSEAGALKSVRYVALVAAGGMANFNGILAVSAALTFLSLRGCFGTFDHAVFGALLIGIVSLAPEGPLTPLAAALRKATGWALRRSRAADAAA